MFGCGHTACCQRPWPQPQDTAISAALPRQLCKPSPPQPQPPHSVHPEKANKTVGFSVGWPSRRSPSSCAGRTGDFLASGSFPRVFWRLKWMPQASFLGPNRCPNRSDRIREYAKRFGYDPTVLRALHPPSALPVPLEYGTSVSTLHGSRKNNTSWLAAAPLLAASQTEATAKTATSHPPHRCGRSHPPPPRQGGEPVLNMC